MEDLEAFLSPEQAKEAFEMLDNNGDGKLVLADIRDAVIKIYKERRNLALSLKVPLVAAFLCSASFSFSNSIRKHGCCSSCCHCCSDALLSTVYHVYALVMLRPVLTADKVCCD